MLCDVHWTNDVKTQDVSWCKFVIIKSRKGRDFNLMFRTPRKYSILRKSLVLSERTQAALDLICNDISAFHFVLLTWVFSAASNPYS